MHRVDVDVLLSDETDYEGSIDNDDDLSSDDDPDARKLDSDVRCSVFPSSVAFFALSDNYRQTFNGGKCSPVV